MIDNFEQTPKRSVSLLEVLVIAAVIGLLGTLSAIALDSARERARDAKRLADIVRLQANLELFFNDFNSYPVVSEAVPLGQVETRCLVSSGFSASCDGSEIYMKPVPAAPTDGLKELVGCGDVASAYCYRGDEESYTIGFELENDNPEAGLTAGANCATELGIQSGSCP